MFRLKSGLALPLSALCLASTNAAAQDRITTPPAATAHPSLWPAAHWPWRSDPAMEARIRSLLTSMSIEEKVGQILQADIASVTPEDVRRYHLGAVLNGGNAGPGGDDYAPPAQWLKLANAFYDASMDTSAGGHAIPVMWGTDAVHGHSNIIGATLFPHNSALGAAHDPALIRRIAAATAIEVRVTGIDWTFAPTITVPQDTRWGRAFEGYSSDPALVASYAGPFIEGLQGRPNSGPILAGPHVIATAKHFLADGGTAQGRDQGDAQISEEKLRDIHGTPYVAAINAGVLSIMASFSSWNGEKMTGNHSMLTDVLKKRMDFGGLVVSDWNAHGQVAGCSNASCPRAITAGIDMLMAPDSWKALYTSLNAQARDGTLPMTRLDEAVASVLRVKMRAGLFEAGRPSSRPYAGRFDLLGAPDHRAIAREAVRKSLVLLKNAGNILPLAPGSRILVAGDGADDVARQSGGWTLSWQGTGLSPAMFPGATTLWQGLRKAAADAGGQATFSPDGSFTGPRPDAAIVIFGETPYAEFQGDISSLRLKPDQRAPLETMRQLKAQGIPVIAVMLTGRPLWTNPELNTADAFVMAWLPGSEGGGVADMLLRPAQGPARNFVGRLPFAWPATARPDGPLLFPLGYGLTGKEPGGLKKLSEEARVAEDIASADIYLNKGIAGPGWSLEMRDSAGSTRITTVPAVSAGGRVIVAATDHIVQEGARRFTITGQGAASVAITSQDATDLSRQTNGEMLLVATLRIDQAPAMPVRIAMGSGAGVAYVDAGKLAGLPIGQWRRIGVPLKCFRAGGADLAKVNMPFALETSGPASLSLAEVKLGMEADTTLACAKD
ncbi:glycoside hydrolase family 3 protein [Novosphingobium sediminicola]|uniref:Beta-glucosidase n=1 Tax=Novosphingobium sediminicola TaxID=563162 RepID=A0A7W6CDC1_9SPHN|nr:exo 1,3/1,4-beta-D-glucan glucohydrolase [Novosphingobium sediminicola]MBB3953747.1 beta-glucosidase [Novosphingobium sediminicola]